MGPNRRFAMICLAGVLMATAPFVLSDSRNAFAAPIAIAVKDSSATNTSVPDERFLK